MNIISLCKMHRPVINIIFYLWEYESKFVYFLNSIYYFPLLGIRLIFYMHVFLVNSPITSKVNRPTLRMGKLNHNMENLIAWPTTLMIAHTCIYTLWEKFVFWGKDVLFLHRLVLRKKTWQSAGNILIRTYYITSACEKEK